MNINGDNMIDWNTIYVIGSAAFLSLFALLKIIAPYTPTKKDDKAVVIIGKVLEFLRKAFSVDTSNKKLVIKINK